MFGIIDTAPVAAHVVTLVLISLVFAFMFWASYRICCKMSIFIFAGVSYSIAVLSYVFGFLYVFILVCTVCCGVIVEVIVGNMDNFKKFVKHPFRDVNYKDQNKGVEKIFNKADFYEIIQDTIIEFSNQKVGALLTFERNDSLTEYINKNGVYVKAPLSKELLETIFFVGTRLHDGGVIIKDDQIVAAAVMYPSDANNYSEKYGARHRAAMGISKVTDSITIVVSEETGRISIAMGGELQTVTQNTFLQVFENLMSMEDSE